MRHPRTILLLALLVIQPALAVVAAAPPVGLLSTDEKPVTVEQVQERLTGLEALDAPTEAQTAAISELQSALAFLEEAAGHAAAIIELEAQALSAPSRESSLRDELLAEPVEISLDIQASATVEDLTPQLEAARMQLTSAQRTKAETNAEGERRRVRRAQIPDLMAEANKQREALHDALATGLGGDTPPALAEAHHWRLMAELSAVEARLRRLPVEVANLDARREVLTARLEVADRRVGEALQLVEAWDKDINARRMAVAQQAADEAAVARVQAEQQHEIVLAIRLENEVFALELAETTALIQEKGDARRAITVELEQLRSRFAQSSQLTDRIGLTETVGIVLHRHRAELPGAHSLRTSLHESELELRRVQEREIKLLDQERLLQDLSAAAQLRLAKATDLPDRQEQRAALEKAVIEALAAKSALVKQLHAAYREYFDEELSVLYRLKQELVDETESFKRFIDERILWIKSTDAIQLEDVGQIGLAVLWLLSPVNWQEALDAYWIDLRRQPIPIGAGVLVAIVLIGLRRRMREKLKSLSVHVGRVTTDQQSLTPGALLLTVLIALGWPLLLWLIGWRLVRVTEGTDFSANLGLAFRYVAMLLFVLGLAKELCRPGGLADVHFRWKSDTLKLVRRHLRWMIAAFLPLGFVVILTRAETEHANSLGRVALMVAGALVAIFAYQMLHPQRGVPRGIIAKNRGGWLDRLKGVWFWLLVLLPSALVLVAAAGYSYTAEQLLRRCMDSAALLLLVLVSHAMLLRWLMVAQRRLAYDQARQRLAQARAKAEAEAAAQPDAETPAEAPPAVDDLELDVRTMSAQTRKLLASLVVFALLVGLFFVWVDVLPALGMLRRIELPWSRIVSVTSAISGGGALETVQTTEPVTLADLLLAVVILSVTAGVTRNIPGLLEIMILQRLPFSPSARYAITTMARYTLAILGVVLAFNAIGIGWSKVQWLAAAAAVGLGFGLQEIVANFVSGLIILFERPVRVGDTVTVGSITGTVCRIRIRATTIIDWDRKELIIPNKEFVTGQIINWSLSDAIIRVKIPVGVAYGSDTAKAKRLLLKAAHECPLVLDDPPSTALFLGFGDSSLDLELRVFIPNIDAYVDSRDALHVAIDDAFRKAGVEIAFPQRDLHVRSVRADVPIRQLPLPDPEPRIK